MSVALKTLAWENALGDFLKNMTVANQSYGKKSKKKMSWRYVSPTQRIQGKRRG
jgi:hypothetical protein